MEDKDPWLYVSRLESEKPREPEELMERGTDAWNFHFH